MITTKKACIPSRTPVESAATYLHQLIDKEKYDEFVSAELHFYKTFIKIEEKKEAHEFKYSLIEDVTEEYGLVLKNSIPKCGEIFANRVCYFLPSLDNDLAHTAILYELLREKSAQDNMQILVAGYAENPESPKSGLLRTLATENKITLLGINQSHSGLVHLLTVFNQLGFSQLIIYSIPHLINSWVAAIGAQRVAWMPTKFELSSFRLLKNRISCFGALPNYSCNESKFWRRSKIFLPRNFISNKVGYPGINGVVGTINREEKIRDSAFLDVVGSVLLSNDHLQFSWTGRKADISIIERFQTMGCLHKTNFLGWVAPEPTLSTLSLFLDTPGLSGTVAAMAFANGIPVCTFRGSHSWVEAFENEFIHDPMINNMLDPRRSFIFDDVKSYVERAVQLAVNPELAFQQSKAQQLIARKYMVGDMRSAFLDHFTILNELISEANKSY
jgi:hypothetical protein